MTHTATEIAIRRRNAFLACRHNTHIAAQARPASRRGHRTIGINKGINIATLHGFLVNGRTAGNHNAAHAVRYLMPLEDFSRNLQIFQTAIGAGTDNYLLNGNGFFDILYPFGIARQMGECLQVSRLTSQFSQPGSKQHHHRLPPAQRAFSPGL